MEHAWQALGAPRWLGLRGKPSSGLLPLRRALALEHAQQLVEVNNFQG